MGASKIRWSVKDAEGNDGFWYGRQCVSSTATSLSRETLLHEGLQSVFPYEIVGLGVPSDAAFSCPAFPGAQATVAILPIMLSQGNNCMSVSDVFSNRSKMSHHPPGLPVFPHGGSNESHVQSNGHAPVFIASHTCLAHSHRSSVRGF